MNKNELFKECWNAFSVSSDVAYKQWVIVGFTWAFNHLFGEIRKKEEVIRILKEEGFNKDLEIQDLYQKLDDFQTYRYDRFKEVGNGWSL